MSVRAGESSGTYTLSSCEVQLLVGATRRKVICYRAHTGRAFITRIFRARLQPASIAEPRAQIEESWLCYWQEFLLIV